MPDRLPPLTALRAFDAAARHMSFALAADELNVTPAALSFQIKSLEEHLGAPVFRRLNRAIELTEAGRTLVPGTRDGFASLTAAWRNTQRLTDQSVLTVTSGPAFTALWLAPRLFSFASEHPEIELRFSASLHMVDFDRDDVDVAIRFGQGDDAGYFSQTLIEEWMTPMVAPALAATLKTPADLAKITLIHDDQSAFLNPPIGWDRWLEAAGVEVPEMHGPRFNQADHVEGEALAGVGAIMGRVSLTEAALRDGRLVMPFDLTIQPGAAYRVVCPKGAEKRPQVAAFIRWINGQVKDVSELSDGRRFVSASEINAG